MAYMGLLGLLNSTTVLCGVHWMSISNNDWPFTQGHLWWWVTKNRDVTKL